MVSPAGVVGSPRRRLSLVGALAVALVAATVLVVVRDRDSRSEDPLASRPNRAQRAAAATAALSSLEATVVEGGPAPNGLAGPAATAIGNARRVGVSAFSLRYLTEDPGALTAGSSDWAAAVETSWSLGRVDAGRVARTEVTFRFRWEGDGARIVDIGGGGRRTPLWLAEPVRVLRAPGVVVLAARGAPDPGRYLVLATRATRQVRGLLTGWRGGLVLEVPGDGRRLAAALDADAAAYERIAAVTTTVDGSPEPGRPAHVFVNPDVLGPLTRQGAQVVVSHEATHVATGAATSDLPRWLVEGFADYVALRDIGLPDAVTAAQVAARVRADGVPASLPRDVDFDAATGRLGASYEAAWLACRTLAELGSEDELMAYYAALRTGGAPARELRRIFGFSQREFVSAWQERLEELAA